jgi:tRNA (guanine37-N1)-methyltransferase
VKIDILTLFPQMFSGVLGESILGRAVEEKLLEVNLLQIRNFANDKHRTVDDTPYGGGAGMVMRCEPLYAAWKFAKDRDSQPSKTLLFSPQGKTISQNLLGEYAAKNVEHRLILVCGRYEGIDERFIQSCVDEEISLGDFVLTGGEIPAMAFIDGLVRLLPGVVGNPDSLIGESFSKNLGWGLEYPQYTRPPEFMGQSVPEVLLSGDHKRIAQWRSEQSQARTAAKRPDLARKSHEK